MKQTQIYVKVSCEEEEQLSYVLLGFDTKNFSVAARTLDVGGMIPVDPVPNLSLVVAQKCCAIGLRE